ncbi:MAG: transglutaminase family protein [Microbacterium sp.]
MSIKVALTHRTSYSFAKPIAVSPHLVRLRPAPHTRTPIESYSLDVSPANHFINWQQDPFGNWVARLVFPDRIDHLDITVGLVADMKVINPFDFFIEESAEHFPFDYAPALKADLAPYLRSVDDADEANGWRSHFDRLSDRGPTTPTVQFLADLNTAVYNAVSYDIRMEPGVQTPDHTLERAIGSCRDSAWLLVALLRQYGLAARFVSGYLVQLAADQKSLDGPSGPAEDFTDLHAWCEVYIPGAGWVGLDPTSALFAGEGHIPLSATPSPSSAAPIEGATEPVEVTFDFENSVRRVHEDPRTTKPYSDAQWARIDAAGELVDKRLKKMDVRLTMGGEPTFVALDDQESAQWNTDADGPHKRQLANVLAERLRQKYAPQGAVHRGQGKWYPGEPLPRWNIALQWRTDGVPLWHDAALFDDPWSEGPSTGSGTDGASTGPSTGSGQATATEAAEALGAEVTKRMGLPASALLPAFEDPLVAIAAEVRQPDGPRPDDIPTRDDLAILDRDVTEPVGWVLPIVAEAGRWTSPAWRFRRGKLFLTQGTSSVGLRLPLDSIAWKDPETASEPSYFEAASTGPSTRSGQATATGGKKPKAPKPEVVEAEAMPRTALAFEPREGHVFVFLPPTEELDDYAALLDVIERSAAAVGTTIVIEGYMPPPDARLAQIIVTPDPGVIEVNVHPTSSWAEQRDLTLDLYDEARQARLSTEKFDLDGLHTGTGGGNHITLGGPTPADSPMLRRPDVLASLIAYWQRHPSLSYLFSGRFIGPTSQAPRFDEGRPEAVYEMEIALRELDRQLAFAAELDEDPVPWIADRTFRNLLTDLTGNTHRAEFCIDKLYAPGTSRGRLGLLEMRGFEMPPHAQLALVQALLVRGLVALFWQNPQREPLVRWGTHLHEDFLLPEGAARDIRMVAADLRAAGIPFEDEWFDPFIEFRFPRIGSREIATPTGAIQLELRQAIEPWNVLGEEASSGGTARYVDSSLERLQVKVSGLDPAAHLVTCNGVPVPLKATGALGEYYAGVRYVAWQPWSSLHPSIEVQAPLTVDVFDAATGLSLGGSTYHVVHPGGRSYDAPPVNANEAEARRGGRFEPHGHTVGVHDVAALRERAAAAASPDYPHTLDLRRA